MKQCWIVYDTAPSTVSDPSGSGKGFWKVWDYASNYFPRKFHYKKDAKICAADALSRGGVDVRVEKVKK